MPEIKKLDPEKVKPPKSARAAFDPEAMEELRKNIEELGIIQPIVVRETGEGYELIVGERRRRAAIEAGEKVPALIKNASNREALEMIMSENVHRRDLKPAEKGKICDELMKRFPDKYPTQRALADRLGVVRSKISTWIKHSKAPEYIQKHTKTRAERRQRVSKGKLSERSARHIITKIKEPERQEDVARVTIEGDLTERQTSVVTKRAAREPGKPAKEIAKEVKAELPEIPFRSEFKEPILKGRKIQTARKSLPPKAKEGQEARVRFTEPRGCKIRYKNIGRKRLGDFDEKDYEREGLSSGEFKSWWEAEVGEYDPNERVYVIRFELVD